MEYFMMPTEKALQQFKKTEKDVIGGLCRCVLHNHASDKMCILIATVSYLLTN